MNRASFTCFFKFVTACSLFVRNLYSRKWGKIRKRKKERKKETSYEDQGNLASACLWVRNSSFTHLSNCQFLYQCMLSMILYSMFRITQIFSFKLQRCSYFPLKNRDLFIIWILRSKQPFLVLCTSTQSNTCQYFILCFHIFSGKLNISSNNFCVLGRPNVC